jgi:hypothetical protein
LKFEPEGGHKAKAFTAEDAEYAEEFRDLGFEKTSDFLGVLGDLGG